MTEALAVVDSLRAASQLPTLTNESSLTLNTTLISNTDRKVLPLKMALFNLQKYIKEGEFVVEFMLKGGLKLLMALLERSSGGLTGNSLAVCQPCDFVLISVCAPRSSRSSRVRIQLGRCNRSVRRPSPPSTRLGRSAECHQACNSNRQEISHLLASLLW
jgi:hypothetical protein